MKKLLVLLIVVLFAGVANAGVDLVVDVNAVDLPATVAEVLAVDLDFIVTVTNDGNTSDANTMNTALMYSSEDMNDAEWFAYFADGNNAAYIVDENDVNAPAPANDVVFNYNFSKGAGVLDVGAYYFRAMVDVNDDITEDFDVNNLSTISTLTIREEEPNSTLLVYSLKATAKSMSMDSDKIASTRYQGYMVVDPNGQLLEYEDLIGTTVANQAYLDIEGLTVGDVNSLWDVGLLVCLADKTYFDANDPNDPNNLSFMAMFSDPNDPKGKKMASSIEFAFGSPDGDNLEGIVLTKKLNDINYFYSADVVGEKMTGLAARSYTGAGEYRATDSSGYARTVALKFNSRLTKAVNDPDDAYYAETVPAAIVVLKSYVEGKGYTEVAW